MAEKIILDETERKPGRKPIRLIATMTENTMTVEEIVYGPRGGKFMHSRITLDRSKWKKIFEATCNKEIQPDMISNPLVEIITPIWHSDETAVRVAVPLGRQAINPDQPNRPITGPCEVVYTRHPDGSINAKIM